MPAEVFIRTGERSALSYFVKPLMDQVNMAMKGGLCDRSIRKLSHSSVSCFIGLKDSLLISATSDFSVLSRRIAVACARARYPIRFQ